jgi:hypothetical protein
VCDWCLNKFPIRNEDFQKKCQQKVSDAKKDWSIVGRPSPSDSFDDSSAADEEDDDSLHQMSAETEEKTAAEEELPSKSSSSSYLFSTSLCFL